MVASPAGAVRVLSVLMRLLLRWRYAVLLIVAAWVFAQWYQLRFGDFLLLEYVGRVALHHHGYPGGWSAVMHVYADTPRMQMGPPVLWAAIPTQLLNPHDGGAVVSLVMMLDLVVVVALLEWTARIVGVNPTRTRPAALIGGLLAMPVWMILAITAVHLDDVIVLTCVAASLPMVARGRWLPAGALLGTAVATKPWAVVVVPLVFALPRRVMPRAVLVTVAVSVLWWVPFLIADASTPWALSGIPIPVTPDSTYGLLGYHGHGAGVCAPLYGCLSAAPSWLRPLQFGAGFGFALLAVRRGRWLAAPLVGLATRVLLDSQAWGYYFVGPVIAALAWDIAQGRRIPRWAIVVAAAEYAGFVIHGNATQAAIRLVMCAVVIYWFAVRRSTPRHQQIKTATDVTAAQLAPAPA